MVKSIGHCAYHIYKRHLLDLSVRDWGQSIMISDESLNCKHCERPYKPHRSDQQFCGAKCRVYASRSTQNALSSPTVARTNAEFFDTARLMGERLYQLPPKERLGHIQSLIADARQGNVQLRNLLSNWKLRRPHPENETWMFPRGSRAYCTIAQAAQNYCKRFWNANVDDVVYCRVSEPPTGEVYP